MNSFGYSGKILRVNLANGEIRIEKPDDTYYQRYLGGRGIIMHTLLTEIPALADPMGAENKLIFATGRWGEGPFSRSIFLAPSNVRLVRRMWLFFSIPTRSSKTKGPFRVFE